MKGLANNTSPHPFIYRSLQMKKLSALLAALPLLSTIPFATASKALAADLAVTGVPTTLYSLNNSNDFASAYNGAIQLNGRYFFWGGSFCQGLTYQPSDTAILSDAVVNKKTLTIYYKNAASGASCLTGIILTNSGAATNAIPAQPRFR
jgi:hypothetical protein